MTLEEQINVVNQARRKAANSKALIDWSRSEWEKQWAREIREAKERAEAQATAEATLREMALQAYAADPTNKHLAPGVDIRIAAILSYDPEAAFAWALDHKLALQLDKKAFEGIAKTSTLAFVLKREEPTATIATDLSKFVEASDA